MLTAEYYRSEAFTNLRKMYLISTEKLTAAEKKISELEADIEKTKRELLTVNTDCRFPSLLLEKQLLTNI